MHRLSWSNIASETRIPQKTPTNAEKYRSEFESNYYRIIRSASFRRLQDKTQVFPLDNSDFVRTRLTHSLEISSIAKLVSKQVCIQVLDQQLAPVGDQPDSLKVTEILSCTGLLYDTDNPPLGHFGKGAIRNWFKKNLSLLQFKQRSLQAWLDEQQQADPLYCENSARALRIIVELHRLTGRNDMHLASSVMDTIIEHPVNSLERLAEDTKERSRRSLLRREAGYYQGEADQFLEIKQDTGTTGYQNPLCFILGAADDLAYILADSEDGYKKGLYPYEQLLDVIVETQDEREAELLRWGLEEGRQLKKTSEKSFDPYQHAVFTQLTKKQLFSTSGVSDAFLKRCDTVMNGELDQELLAISREEQLIRSLRQSAFDRVYNDAAILKLELTGDEIVTFLLDRFVDALLPYDSGLNMNEIQEECIDLLSGNYLSTHQYTAQSKEDGERLYLRLLLGADFVTGMTDNYAIRLYQGLKRIQVML